MGVPFLPRYIKIFESHFRGICPCIRCKRKPKNGNEEQKKLKRNDEREESSPKRAKLDNAFLSYIEDLNSRERRCDQNIREMEKLMGILKKEKEDILLEKDKIELSLKYFSN